MSTRERAEELLADFLPRLEELKDESLARIAEVREDASAKMYRHDEARAELERVGEEISALDAEKDGLPVLHSQAVLEDAVDEELRIKQRYQDIGPELEELLARKTALEAEIRGLLPRDLGHHHDARIHHGGRIAGTAHDERMALEDLRDRLTDALDAAVEPVAKIHNDRRALVEAWGMEREWNPEFRERAYGHRPRL